MGNEEATSLFKDYVDALFSNDLDGVKDRLEPTFYSLLSTKLQTAHQTLVTPYKLNCQNLRRNHETEFFLYNIENFLLSGEVSLDRSKNLPED